MLETLQRTGAPGASFGSTSASVNAKALIAGWREGLSVVNLRGNADDPAFCAAVSQALGMTLPTQPCTTADNGTHRIVWAGPDDWFVIGPAGQADALAARLRDALAGTHHAVTDVSGGYTVLHLSGTPVREVLAQGCPLDLHPRVFHGDASAGSLFFKASVWLWHGTESGSFELLVRRSFTGYVWLMLERCTLECGLVTRRFV